MSLNLGSITTLLDLFIFFSLLFEQLCWSIHRLQLYSARKKDVGACLATKVEGHSRIREKISQDLSINQDTLVPFRVFSPV